MVSLGDLRGGPLAYGLTDYLILTGLYLAALLVISQSKDHSSPALLSTIVALGLVFRGIMLFQEPSLSDDIFRYLWEGKVTLNGFNPFVYAPSSPELEFLRDEIWLGVNHKDISAIYPPIMQGIFLFVACCGGHFMLVKFIFVLFDLAVAALVVKALRERKKGAAWVVVYFWHPLLIMEVAGQGHFEVVPAALLLLAFYALNRNRAHLSSAALWFSIGAKYLPIVFLPSVLVQHYKRKHKWRAALLGPLLLFLAFLPFVEPGWTSALSSYGSRWRFNDSGFWLIDTGLKASGFSAWFCRNVLTLIKDPGGHDFGVNQTYLLLPAKLIIAALIGSLLLFLLYKKRPPLESAFYFFCAFFILSPVVHPWYLIWLLPLLPLFPKISCLHLTLTIPLSYEILLRFDGSGETWLESPTNKLLIYLPFAVLAILESVWRSQRQDFGGLEESMNKSSQT
jgi:alpha-1,6-mannosyltransferase